MAQFINQLSAWAKGTVSVAKKASETVQKAVAGGLKKAKQTAEKVSKTVKNGISDGLKNLGKVKAQLEGYIQQGLANVERGMGQLSAFVRSGLEQALARSQAGLSILGQTLGGLGTNLLTGLKSLVQPDETLFTGWLQVIISGATKMLEAAAKSNPLEVPK